ncbi:ATP phosphoribosyltransferase catalytic subunit HisG, partial [Mesorhizobium sp. M5C.F.Ca.IN.020.29.1.1]
VILRSQACLVASRKLRTAADEAILRDLAAKVAGAIPPP